MSNDAIFAAAAGYPHWDDAYASVLESIGDVHVTLDVDPTEDGSTLVIRRTVSRKAYRARDRHILWIGEVARIPRAGAAAFAHDLVASLTA